MRIKVATLAARFLLLITVLTGVSAAQVREWLPVPDVAGYKTLKGDFHTHTVFSDGHVWPTLRVQEAWRDGLDVLVLSDHADIHSHEKDLKTDAARPYGIAQPLAEQLGLVLIPGIELRQDDIHINAVFITDPNALCGVELKEAVRRARQQGAFLFWNHPIIEKWLPLIDSLHQQGMIQGVELVNGDRFFAGAFPWIDEKNLAILSNSDVHWLTTPGSRAITLVFARTADAVGVRDALFAHRTAAWMGGELWGAEQYLKGLWDGAVKVENPHLTRRAGPVRLAIRLRNQSAIPFRFRARQAPAWLAVAAGELRPEKVSSLVLTLNKDASARSTAVELELEITNLHTAPGNNLMVRLPLQIDVAP